MSSLARSLPPSITGGLSAAAPRPQSGLLVPCPVDVWPAGPRQQTGVKLFRRQVLESILPKVTVDGFAFDLQLLSLAHRHGYQIVAAPVVLTFQRQRLGRIGLGVVWQIWRDTWSVFRATR